MTREELISWEISKGYKHAKDSSPDLVILSKTLISTNSTMTITVGITNEMVVSKVTWHGKKKRPGGWTAKLEDVSLVGRHEGEWDERKLVVRKEAKGNGKEPSNARLHAHKA